jgi:hypothetical protein
MQDEKTIADHVATIETAEERAEVALSAIALAKSDDPAALDALAGLLARQDVLARLDQLDEPQVKTLNLKRVLKLLAEQPSPETAAVCLRLSREPAFLADDDRQVFLIEALAAVRPMSADTVQYFRDTTAQGYYSFNAPLLVKNGSPAALALFEEMIRDTAVPAERRVDALHAGVLTHRTTTAVLEMVRRLLAANLEPAVNVGLVESVFDYRGKEWFGPHPPVPPNYRTAQADVLRLLVTLGREAVEAPGVSAELRERVEEVMRVATALLARRQA